MKFSPSFVEPLIGSLPLVGVAVTTSVAPGLVRVLDGESRDGRNGLDRSCPVEVALREEGGEGSSQEVLWLLRNRWHQGDREILQRAGPRGVRKLHPGGSRHGSDRDGYDAGMSRHAKSVVLVFIQASSLLMRELVSVLCFFADRLTHLALRFEQVEVVRCTIRHGLLHRCDREELEGRGSETGRTGRAGREGVGGVHLVGEERREREVRRGGRDREGELGFHGHLLQTHVVAHDMVGGGGRSTPEQTGKGYIQSSYHKKEVREKRGHLNKQGGIHGIQLI